MRSLANRLQSITAWVSDGPLCGCEEGLAATEFSAAAMSAVFWGMGLGARDRELAGLWIKNFIRKI